MLCSVGTFSVCPRWVPAISLLVGGSVLSL